MAHAVFILIVAKWVIIKRTAACNVLIFRAHFIQNKNRPALKWNNPQRSPTVWSITFQQKFVWCAKSCLFNVLTKKQTQSAKNLQPDINFKSSRNRLNSICWQRLCIEISGTFKGAGKKVLSKIRPIQIDNVCLCIFNWKTICLFVWISMVDNLLFFLQTFSAHLCQSCSFVESEANEMIP